MSNTTFVVALRLVGIWIILTWSFQTLNWILTAAFQGGGQISTAALGSFSVHSAAWLIFGFALLFRSVAFGQLLVPGGVRGGGPTPWSIDDFQTVAFKIIGLFLIVTAITSSDLLRIPFHLLLGDPAPIRPGFAIVAITVKITVGSLLLFRARRLVDFLDRGGQARKPEAAPSNE